MYLKKHALIENSFGIKNRCELLAKPISIEEVIECLRIAKNKNLRINIFGKGTNTLICKDEIDGLIISINNNLSNYSIQDNIMTFQAGMRLSEVSKIALKNSLSGLEFAEGIPGTIGGAVFGNAGAFGETIGKLVQNVKIIDIDKLIVKEKKDLKFSHRKSNIEPNKEIIIEAKLKLDKKDKKDIQEKINLFKERRKETQPIEKSAGCIFKNNQAGKIIDELGLKGTKVGNAEVSNKHANFIINKGNATGYDVLELIEIIKNKAKKEKNIDLDLEINLLK
ncbi:UDP-N-acetylmuramate dehydrogenase [Candidatus Woesearchaeota archaeon]|nr:UDP-N-acetylmuramate dehydrogenase [Candidatus Woesearchaeota archaeon]